MQILKPPSDYDVNDTLLGIAFVAVLAIILSLLVIYPPAFFVILALGIIVYLFTVRYNQSDKIKKGEERGSAFMTMESLRNPVLLLSPKRRKLTENYLKGLSGGDKNNITSSESALDILNKRYANGEISGKEYEEMKRNIEK